jgi:hypothetical protein
VRSSIHAAILQLFPRRLREEYGTEMRRILNEMAADPAASRFHVWRALLSDLIHGLAGGLWIGVIFGGAVLAVWYVGRSQHHMSGMAFIALLLMAAGFFGARQSGSVLGGMWSGFVAGSVSSLTVLGDGILFGFWISDAWSLILTMLIAAAAVMTTVFVGAVLAGIGRHQRRVRRSMRAFVGAWRQPT